MKRRAIWGGALSAPLLFFDLETEPFDLFYQAPRPIVAGYAFNNDSVNVVPFAEFCEVLKTAPADTIFCAHSAAFDFAVLAEWFDLNWVFVRYNNRQVLCTKTQQKLIDIKEGAKGRYSLKDLASRLLHKTIEKPAIRTEFQRLDGVERANWPQEFINYAATDVEILRDIFYIQERQEDVFFQSYADFCLYLTKAWGLRIDREKADQLENETITKITAIETALKEAKFLRPNGTTDMKKLQKFIETHAHAFDRTPAGKISVAKKSFEKIEHPLAKIWLDYSALKKIQTTYLPILSHSCVHANFNVLVETGRTSCAKPNLQNLPRGGSVRRCFTSREDAVLISCDYDSQELRVLAEICQELFGFSALCEHYKDDPNFDPHLKLACYMTNYDYHTIRKNGLEHKLKEARQRAKIANFGLPGGMGARGLVEYARGFGLTLSDADAYDLRTQWLTTFPEMREYLKWCKAQAKQLSITQFYSPRVRAVQSYTSTSNSFFQGLAADITKQALIDVCNWCYFLREPFYVRPVNFVHDEIVVETNSPEPELIAEKIKTIMINSMNRKLKHVPAAASFSISKNWAK